MPTLRPGRTLVPSCRMMMEPGWACCPPYSLTPRRCPALSRPLRQLPCPFLCAMVVPRSGVVLDRVDLDLRNGLSMALLAPVILAPFELEYDDLGSLGLGLDGCL